MEYDHDVHRPESLAFRSIVLPAAASALLALGEGLVFPCHSGPGVWLLLAAPAFAVVGAVGGPERQIRRRLEIGLISGAINVFVMLAVGTGFSRLACDI